MDTIGGYFSFDPLKGEENHFFEDLCPKDGNLKFLMSGRCGIYYVLEDIKLTDKKRVAYVPIYTCETVLAPFEKAGFELCFYDVDKSMTPVFEDSVLDNISVILICGYYGFCNYDRDFVRKCSEKGIVVLEDTTHSIFSKDGIDEHCDYIVGSLRKWIGVPSGGFAIKTKGEFTLPMLEPDPVHMSMRNYAMHTKKKVQENPDKYDVSELDDATTKYWDTEMMLRKIFDKYKSDKQSIYIMKHFDVQDVINKRVSNYRYLLDNMKPHPGLTIVFPLLTDKEVPSHFTLYARERSKTQDYLKQNGISTTAYWTKGPLIDLENHPDATYIYDHVFSIPCDHRYDNEHMKYICDTLEKMPE